MMSSTYKQSTSSIISFLRYQKDTPNLLLLVICSCLTRTSQNYNNNLYTTLIFIFTQKLTSFPIISSALKILFLLLILKTLHTFYFGYFEHHAKLHPPKMIVATAENQIDPSLPSWDITLYRILQSDWSKAFWPITQEQNFARYRVCIEISINIDFNHH